MVKESRSASDIVCDMASVTPPVYLHLLFVIVLLLSLMSLLLSLCSWQHRIQPLSVLAKGVYGIQEEVFLSLPGVLGREGLLALGKVRMSDVEECQMRESARALWNIQKDLDLRV